VSVATKMRAVGREWAFYAFPPHHPYPLLFQRRG